MDRLIEALIRAGGAVVELRPRDKRPKFKNWTEVPRPSLEYVRERFAKDANIGLRFGEPSKINQGWMHLIDFDIRDETLRDQALDRLRTVVGDETRFDCVQSGSGGSSRHFYFVSDKPFRSRKLLHSVEKFRMPDGKMKWSWEIDLKGTGTQAVLPPSIHPVTRKPYRWLTDVDFDNMFFVASEIVETWTPEERKPTPREYADDLEQFRQFNMDRPRFSVAELTDIVDRIMDCPPAHELLIEDREGWLKVGMCLHHESQGSERGYELWCACSAESEKFDEEDQRRVWDSFGKNNREKKTGKSLLLEISTIEQAYATGSLPSMLSEAEGDGADDFGVQHALLVHDETALDEADPGPMADDPGDGYLPDRYHDIFEKLFEEEAKRRRAELRELDRKQTEYLKELDKTDSDQIRANPYNVSLLMRHDPRIRGVIAFNEFRQEIVCRKKFPVVTAAMLDLPLFDPIGGDMWTADHDRNVKMFFATPQKGAAGGFGMKISESAIYDAVAMAATENTFHPIKEYLESLRWDGVSRADSLFVRHLRSPDRPYYREVARITLLAAVTRVYEPGHKFDFAPILEGPEGMGKSSFVKALAKGWFGELRGNFRDSQKMVEQMQNCWHMELPDLAGLNKVTVEEVKAFMSADHDKVRLAYEKRAGVYRRQVVFWGTTNDAAYLASETGNRRFFPVLVRCTKASPIDVKAVAEEADQIWAEVYAMYRVARSRRPVGLLPLYLSDEAAADEALKIQASRKTESLADVYAGMLEKILNTPTTRADITGETSDKFEKDEHVWVRSAICSSMAADLLNIDKSQEKLITTVPAALAKMDSYVREPGDNRLVFPQYGRQRAFIRKGASQLDVKMGYMKIPKTD